MPAAKSEGRKHNQQYEDEGRNEGSHDGAADSLAEVVELLANGEPVGLGVPVVGQVHDGCCCRGRSHRESHQRLHVFINSITLTKPDLHFLNKLNQLL